MPSISQRPRGATVYDCLFGGKEKKDKCAVDCEFAFTVRETA
jgi:hypothetical protein